MGGTASAAAEDVKIGLGRMEPTEGYNKPPSNAKPENVRLKLRARLAIIIQDPANPHHLVQPLRPTTA